MEDINEGSVKMTSATLNGDINDPKTKEELINSCNYDEFKFKHTTIKSVLLFIFVVLTIVTEMFYRKGLYDKSVTFIEEWQKDPWPTTKIFFQIMTSLGGEYCLVIYLLLIYFFFPLSKSFSFVIGIIACIFLDNVMKLLYHDPRPFWTNTDLYSGSCDGGFGNPSGHAYASTFTYLGFFRLLSKTKFFANKLMYKVILFLVALFFIITIVLSRIYLAMHSFNQILYGCLLGFSVYYLIFHILYMHEMKTQTYVTFFTNKINIIIFLVSFIISFLVLLGSYLLIDFYSITSKEVYQKLMDSCSIYKEDKIYRKFENDGMFGGLTLFCLIGAYIGQLFLWYKVHQSYGTAKDELINNWVYSRSSVFSDWIKELKLAAILLLCAVPMVIYLIISGENLAVIFLFKVSIPFFSSLFLLYGPGLYLMISLGLANNEILLYNQDTDAFETLV